MDTRIIESGMMLFDTYVGELKQKSSSSDFDESYYTKHRARFEATLAAVPLADSAGCQALELGATDYFQLALRHLFGYERVIGTQFSQNIEEKYYTKEFIIADRRTKNLTISVNLEHEFLPIPENSINLAMCCEVLEHMDIDPMFMLGELNRVCAPGASLIITTPNCCSARNFWKIAHGFRPYFFMQYEISRSPYRHNIEWDVHGVAQLCRAAGFEPYHLETRDVFEDPLPEANELLRSAGLPLENRGDCIISAARKVSSVTDRWPPGIYI
jgi:SAM-dependent methyltransferase